MCPRRLDHEYRGEFGSDDPVNRGRVRDAFLDAARTAHTLGRPARDAPWRSRPGSSPKSSRSSNRPCTGTCTCSRDRAGRAARPRSRPSVRGRRDRRTPRRLGRPHGRRRRRHEGAAPTRLLGGRSPRGSARHWKRAAGAAPPRRRGSAGEPVLVSWTDVLHGVRTRTDVDDPRRVRAAHPRGPRRSGRASIAWSTARAARPGPEWRLPAVQVPQGLPGLPEGDARCGTRRGDTLPGRAVDHAELRGGVGTAARALWRSQHLLVGAGERRFDARRARAAGARSAASAAPATARAGTRPASTRSSQAHGASDRVRAELHDPRSSLPRRRRGVRPRVHAVAPLRPVPALPRVGADRRGLDPRRTARRPRLQDRRRVALAGRRRPARPAAGLGAWRRSPSAARPPASGSGTSTSRPRSTRIPTTGSPTPTISWRSSRS